MQTQKQITRKPVAMQKSARASPQTHLMQFVFGAALIACLLFAYYAISWRNANNFRAAMDTCAKPFCDFATFYYPMGKTIFQAGRLLNGFVYSPFIAILLAVFPSLGLDASLLLWGVLQAIFVLLCLFTFRQLVPARLPIQLLFVALVLSSFPLLHHLTWGQVMTAGRLALPALCSLWLLGGLCGSNSNPKSAAMVDRNPLRIPLSGHCHVLPVGVWTSHQPLGIAYAVLFAISTVLNITSH